MTERKIDVVAMKLQFCVAAICPITAGVINLYSSKIFSEATFTSYGATSLATAGLLGIGFAYGRNALSEYKELKRRFRVKPSLANP